MTTPVLSRQRNVVFLLCSRFVLAVFLLRAVGENGRRKGLPATANSPKIFSFFV
jgi:hypothetical protein